MTPADRAQLVADLERDEGVRSFPYTDTVGKLTIGVGRWLEGRNSQIADQGWQFYAVVGCVMLTLAFPGFVWRYLRRRH